MRQYTYEFIAAFLVGAIAYPPLEILWRGYSHWTMAITAGLCTLLLYILYSTREDLHIWKKCLLGAMIVTVVEFLVGCVVNIMLGWRVWDYSRVPGNLMGQVCAPYFAVWIVLSLPIIWISRRIKYYSEAIFPSRYQRNPIQRR